MQPSQFNFSDYTENLAREHSLVKHSSSSPRFYKMTSIASLEGVLTNLLHAKTPAIAINDTLEGRVVDNSADRVIDRQLYTFYVFGRAGLFNHEERSQVTKEIKQIAVDFCDRILSDHHDDFNFKSSTGLRNLDTSSLTYRTLGNLPDGLIAIIASFVVEVPVTPSKNPWQ